MYRDSLLPLIWLKLGVANWWAWKYCEANWDQSIHVCAESSQILSFGRVERLTSRQRS